MLGIMDFNSSVDMDQYNFMDILEHDVQQEMEKFLHNSEKMGTLDSMLNNTASDNPLLTTSQMEVDTGDLGNLNWMQNLDWNDVASKMLNPLEIENNNPNLLVNPRTGLPVQQERQLLQNQQVTQAVNNLISGVKMQSSSPSPQTQLQFTAVQTTPTSLPPGYLPVTVSVTPQLQIVRTSASSTVSQNSPVLVEHLQSGIVNKSVVTQQAVQTLEKREKIFPKPVYSYSCLIAMALKNSKNGSLPVSEIYSFMTENFPYFKTAPDGWKNSVRHNLSLNKCFQKVENPKLNSSARKGCLWALNPAKVEKMEEEIAKWRKKDLDAVKSSMAKPEILELIEAGQAGPNKPSSKETAVSSSVATPTSVTTTAPRHIREDHILLGDLSDFRVLDNSFSLDPALSELALQNGLWDEDMNGDIIELPISSSPAKVVPASSHPNHGSPLTIHPSGTLGSSETVYQGNFMYTTSPIITRSPMVSNGASSHIYSQTPPRVLIALT